MSKHLDIQRFIQVRNAPLLHIINKILYIFSSWYGDNDVSVNLFYTNIQLLHIFTVNYRILTSCSFLPLAVKMCNTGFPKCKHIIDEQIKYNQMSMTLICLKYVFSKLLIRRILLCYGKYIDTQIVLKYVSFIFYPIISYTSNQIF